MSYFGDLITELGDRVKEFDVTTEPGRTIAKRYINRSARWLYMAHPWEWRYKMGEITLIPNYSTGTCGVTQYNGSNESAARTVTFAGGATVTTAMQGRFLKVDGEDYWHRIVYVNTTDNQVMLETPIIRTTASGLTFDIWKRFYYLNGDVAAIMDFGRWDNRFGRLEYRSFSNLVDRVQDISDDGNPEDFTPFGVDNYEPSYSTGTIEGAKDSNLITGTGTAWLGSVLSGDELTQGENVFTLKRFQTDGRVILNNYLPEAIPASSTYTIRRNLSIGFQFYPNKVDDYMTIPFYYYDKIFDMVHQDLDRPNLPDEFDEAILTRAEFKLKKDKSDPNWLSIAQLFSAELRGLKADFRIARPRFDIFAPETRGYPGR